MIGRQSAPEIRVLRTATLVLLAASVFAACGSDEEKACPYDEQGIACWHQQGAELCDSAWPETCSSGKCLTGLLSGTYRPGSPDLASVGWSVENAICAEPCKIDGDCSSQSFGLVNRASYEVQSETWRCADIEKGLFCAVETVAPQSVPQLDLCDGCGPPHCSGKCAACPECS
jgi:hypothetical protein